MIIKQGHHCFHVIVCHVALLIIILPYYLYMRTHYMYINDFYGKLWQLRHFRYKFLLFIRSYSNYLSFLFKNYNFSTLPTFIYILILAYKQIIINLIHLFLKLRQIIRQQIDKIINSIFQ